MTKDIEVYVRVPLYFSSVYMVLTKSIKNARNNKRWNVIFGEWEAANCCDGLTSHNFDFNVFAVFLDVKKVGHNVIGHEVYHLADRIFQCIDAKYDNHGNECFALLVGWLTEWVYNTLKKNGVHVKEKRLAK